MPRLGLCALPLVMFAFGCGPKGATTGTQGKPADSAAIDKVLGGSEVASKDGSFSMTLPKGWVSADKNDPGFKKIADSHKDSPAIKMIETLTGNAMIQLMAFDSKAIEEKREFVDNVNVVVLPADAALKNEDAASLAKDASQGLFGGGQHK